MKKLILVTLFTILMGALFAHSAQEVTATYDQETKLLTVNFEHKVRDAADHFIKEVEIEVNDKEIISQLISQQETKEGGRLIYRIPDLKLGDQVKIILECNKRGEKSTTFTVE
jgi:hypothetical protein